MGLLDILNGMQNGPRGPSNPNAEDKSGMSPITMAILALLRQSSTSAAAANPRQPLRRRPHPTRSMPVCPAAAWAAVSVTS